MGKPAARVGDMHVCPKTNPGPVPHVGGPIAIGSPNVIIGGMPAARVGDMAVCIGPPDKTSSGSSTVMINGKPASRMGDSCGHGGKIIIGCPTVLIGDSGGSGAGGGASASSSGGASSPASSSASQKPKPTPKEALPQKPQNLAECEQRIAQAKQEISACRAEGKPLPKSPYTTADKKRIVEEGLDEKYIVRIVESKYAGDNGSIGNPHAEVKTYWTTTFTQLEHADSDAKLICDAVGIDYKPDSQYTMLLIDQEAAAEAGDMLSFIPTSDNLSKFARQSLKQELKGKEHLVSVVMGPEYSKYYEFAVNDAKEQELNLWNKKHFEIYTAEMDGSTKDILSLRQTINNKLGANEHFLGNGLTKDLAASGESTPFGDIDLNREYGVAEVFTHDKNPKTLAQLEKNDKILKRIALS